MNRSPELKLALEDVEHAFWQVEFSTKLLSLCELGRISPSDFDTDHIVRLDEGTLHFPSGHFTNPENITIAASIAVSLAFGASALALNTVLDLAGIQSDPKSRASIERIRALVYMIRCAYAHGIADPRWEARGEYACMLVVEHEGLSLRVDLGALHGQRFDFAQIGGHLNWYRIKHTVIHAIA
jgi:hypothetical protein